MKEIENPPYAPSLLESMRSIGYSLESALADLIDNSISAKAKKINIEYRPYDSTPYIAIIDDGIGMSRDILSNAMRHGSTNPCDVRALDDLGRYGLGMKTASLSQCRKMTVISLMKNGVLTAFCWDLDLILSKQAWVMLELDEPEIALIPHVEKLKEWGSGTIVLWQQLDKLAAGESSLISAIGEKMDVARKHLALVFHRFINHEYGHARILISMNGLLLPAIDPFLSDHAATQYLDEDSFKIDSHKITVKPYILPHISKLSPSAIEQAGGAAGIRSLQGFYIYRNRRLIMWGTWFRLAKKDELSKLARVRVDIPNTLDHLWTLDVKKSVAFPPEAVRINLRRTIDRIRSVSSRTIVFRGHNIAKGDITPGWLEVLNREGVRFDINRDHPLIKMFKQSLSKDQQSSFDSVLNAIENTFPAEALYSRMASDIRAISNEENIENKLQQMLISIFSTTEMDQTIKMNFLKNLHLIEPFNQNIEITKKIVKEWESHGN
ncbi:ATP-binding protein [Acinetobacter pseudolwoffii]|uniref:ATP-binding protein n=1 Tax=Acinetobacter pseudolwoffii TaxID=2053287 RepID=UPI0025752F68|nr:ATP-binding protein [Acinetobacter pseudolwoffii]MDM1345271.1 ATP-binding protein [Acinetobacter pseudolwoffii]